MIMMNRCKFIKKLNDKNKHKYMYNVYEHITYSFVLQVSRITMHLFKFHDSNYYVSGWGNSTS